MVEIKENHIYKDNDLRFERYVLVIKVRDDGKVETLTCNRAGCAITRRVCVSKASRFNTPARAGFSYFGSPAHHGEKDNG